MTKEELIVAVEDAKKQAAFAIEQEEKDLISEKISELEKRLKESEVEEIEEKISQHEDEIRQLRNVLDKLSGTSEIDTWKRIIKNNSNKIAVKIAKQNLDEKGIEY